MTTKKKVRRPMQWWHLKINGTYACESKLEPAPRHLGWGCASPQRETVKKYAQRVLLSHPDAKVEVCKGRCGAFFGAEW